MVKFTKLYSGGISSLKEGDIFKITIPLTKLNSKNNLPINVDKSYKYWKIAFGSNKNRKYKINKQ